MAPVERRPSLNAEIIHGNSEKQSVLDINSSPVDIDNDLFQGKIVLIDSVYDSSTSLALQVQGRFRRQLKGNLWFGAEIRKPMELGWFTSSICQGLFALMRPLVGNTLCWSFGDGKRGGYLSAPASLCCDVLVTPPDEKAPTLGSLNFANSPQHQDSQQVAHILSDEASPISDYVFTFSFSCMYMDLYKWEVVNVPGFGSLSLEYFWGDQREFQLILFEAEDGNERKDRNSIVNLALINNA